MTANFLKNFVDSSSSSFIKVVPSCSVLSYIAGVCTVDIVNEVKSLSLLDLRLRIACAFMQCFSLLDVCLIITRYLTTEM